MKNEIVLRPSYWASVSGGKDSLYMLYLILQHPEKYKLDGVVHYELEIDYPFIKDVIDYMESECRKHEIIFVRIKPDVSYFDLLKQYGVPTRVTRWCNFRYKLNAKDKLVKFLRGRGEYLVSYIGYCYDEEKRYKTEKSIKNKNIYPLVDFKVNENDIWEWAKNQTIFNDYYKYNKRCGCMYCPMASRMNMAYLLKYYPDNYEWFIEQCKKHEQNMRIRYNKPFSIFNGKAKYDAVYVDNIIRKKWLPKLEKMERN